MEDIAKIHTGMFSFDPNEHPIGGGFQGGMRRSFEFEDEYFEESKEVHISKGSMESEEDAWEEFPENPPRGIRFIVDLFLYDFYEGGGVEIGEDSEGSLGGGILRMFIASNQFLISAAFGG